MALLDRLLILIDADGRRATAELDKLGKKTKETLSVGQEFGRDFLKGLGLGAGAFSGFAAADALKQLTSFTISAAQAAEQDARSQLVLAKTLQISAGATFEQINATEEWINRTSHAVGVLDDKLRPALATFVRSTHDAVIAQRLLTLALDVSVGTGTDVETVSLAMAKAWEGQTTALTRLLPEVGGIVREGGSAEDAFNDLQATFGGTATAAQNTAGKFAELKVKLDDLKEGFGSKALPLVGAIESGFGHVSDFLDTKFGKIAASGGPFGLVLRGINELGSSSSNAAKVLEGTATPAVEDFSGAAKILANDMDGAKSAVRNFRDALADLAAAGDRQLSSIFGVSAAQDKFNSTLDSMTSSSGGATRSTRDSIAVDFDKERSARSVLQAQLDLLDAEKDLETIRKGASEREKNRARLDTTSAQNRVAQAQQRIADATNALNKATGRRGNTADAANARQALTDAILEEERARMDLLDTQDRENDTMKRGTAGSEDLADATKKVEDAQWNLRDAIESQRTQALQDESDGGPVGRTIAQQRDGYRQAAKEAKGIVEELIKAGAPQGVINEQIDIMIGKLNAAGTAAGFTKKEIQDTADLLVALGIINQAEAERQSTVLFGLGDVGTLVETLISLRKRGHYVPDIAFQLAGGRAGGGSVNAGSSYRINEDGRSEILTMGNSPGWVTPAGGGGLTVNFNGTVVADKVTLERMVFEAYQSAQRRGWN